VRARGFGRGAGPAFTVRSCWFDTLSREAVSSKNGERSMRCRTPAEEYVTFPLTFHLPLERSITRSRTSLNSGHAQVTSL
jgi:hypothetical protein